jgi:hypothetical protein
MVKEERMQMVKEVKEVKEPACVLHISGHKLVASQMMPYMLGSLL